MDRLQEAKKAYYTRVRNRQPFDKDLWIQAALCEREYVVQEDGRIFKFKGFKRRTDGVAGVVRRYVPVNFSIHKPSGRVYFNMRFDQQVKSVLVNRVVGLALIENPLNKPEVNHIDGNRQNNHPSNLEWTTRSENEQHAAQNTLKSVRGTSNSNAKLSVGQVVAIRESQGTLSSVAEEFGVSPSTIKAIRDRKTWTHI